MGHGWSTDEMGEATTDRAEILDAIESWLVDPRCARTEPPAAAAPAEIRLDADLASFLAGNGLA